MNMAFMNVQNPCSSFVRRSKAPTAPTQPCYAQAGPAIQVRQYSAGQSTRLRIWGSGVRISPGAPIGSKTYVNFVLRRRQLILTGAHIWAHIMRGANVERGACFRSTTRPGPTSKVYQARVVSSSKRLRTTPIPRRIAASSVRLEPGDHSVPQIEPGSHLLYILSNPGNMSGKTMDGCKAPVTSQSTAAPLQSGAAPPVKYAQARNTRRVILVTIAHFGYLRSATRAKEGLRP